MKYCSYCGQPYEGNLDRCPSCNAIISENTQSVYNTNVTEEKEDISKVTDNPTQGLFEKEAKQSINEFEGEAPLEPIHLIPGTMLNNRYVIGKAIGSGGFGIVYKAIDTKLERTVAIKEFFVNRLVRRAYGEKEITVSKKSEEEFRYRKQRFLAEARTMAKFGAHRSIPNVSEFFEENGTAYIVMELLEGITLTEYIEQNRGQIDAEFAIMVVTEIGNALKSLHSEGIIHRDVAPDNIFLCNGKEIKLKLMDLGAAKLKESSDDVIDIILKPGYSPPEQYDNSQNLGPWTDIYSLGATLYMMLTGVKPDESTNRKIEDTVVYPKQLNPDIDENLSNTIMKAMALDVHMRFKNVNEFLLAVNGDKKVDTLAKEKKRRKAKRFTGLAAACLLLCVASSVVFFTYQSRKEASNLKDASISIWYSVKDDSSEESAMEYMVEDFKSSFPNVNIDLRAIPEEEYSAEIQNAANNGSLPNLFESTDIDDSLLYQSVENVLESSQAKDCFFIDQYDSFYQNKFKLPLAIEVPVAYVITAGDTAIDYSSAYFEKLSDFGISDEKIANDKRFSNLLDKNFSNLNYSDISGFLNNSGNTVPVLLSSSMELNEVKNTLVGYEKNYVYYNADEINCNFTYEWSIGNCSDNELAASERLLSWMLGNSYQSILMITKCNDGQIPINELCFKTKTESKYLKPIYDIYEKFVFTK